MKLNKNVLVDGSLRDGEWYSDYIQGIRKSFQGYKTVNKLQFGWGEIAEEVIEEEKLRIGIIYVTARTESILKRAKKRELITHRHVPEELILRSIGEIQKSLEILIPLCNFYCHIVNEDDEEPQIRYSSMRKDFAIYTSEGDINGLTTKVNNTESEIDWELRYISEEDIYCLVGENRETKISQNDFDSRAEIWDEFSNVFSMQCAIPSFTRDRSSFSKSRLSRAFTTES